MDLKIKQMAEKKNVSFVVTLIIQLVMLAFSIYKLMGGFSILSIVRLALVVIPIIITSAINKSLPV